MKKIQTVSHLFLITGLLFAGCNLVASQIETTFKTTDLENGDSEVTPVKNGLNNKAIDDLTKEISKLIKDKPIEQPGFMVDAAGWFNYEFWYNPIIQAPFRGAIGALPFMLTFLNSEKAKNIGFWGGITGLFAGIYSGSKVGLNINLAELKIIGLENKKLGLENKKLGTENKKLLKIATQDRQKKLDAIVNHVDTRFAEVGCLISGLEFSTNESIKNLGEKFSKDFKTISSKFDNLHNSTLEGFKDNGLKVESMNEKFESEMQKLNKKMGSMENNIMGEIGKLANMNKVVFSKNNNELIKELEAYQFKKFKDVYDDGLGDYLAQSSNQT